MHCLSSDNTGGGLDRMDTHKSEEEEFAGRKITSGGFEGLRLAVHGSNNLASLGRVYIAF